tara:strand:+ start:403 stop:552 length:150 start_codon:yes stop_codon:yes gene_type:complete
MKSGRSHKMKQTITTLQAEGHLLKVFSWFFKSLQQNWYAELKTIATAQE